MKKNDTVLKRQISTIEHWTWSNKVPPYIKGAWKYIYQSLMFGSDDKTTEKIEKLPKHRGIKLSSTLSGQRELIREYRNKINEIIEKLNGIQPKQ